MQPKFNFSHLQYAFDLKVIAENKWSRSQDSEIISVEPGIFQDFFFKRLY